MQTFQPVNLSNQLDHSDLSDQFDLSTEAEFNQYLQSNYRVSKTVKAIKQHLRTFALWYQTEFRAQLNPHELTNYAIGQWRKHSLDVAKVSASTWNSRFWSLQVLTDFLSKPELLEGITPKEHARASTRHRALTKDEYHRFNNALEIQIQKAVTAYEYHNSVRDWASASLMLQAGLRVEEVTLLDVSDITINERSGSVRVRDGKGDKERVVDLNIYVRNALKKWLQIRNQTNQVLFAGDGSERISTRTLQRAIKAIGNLISVPDVTCHWLRYTAAKMCEAHNSGRGLPYSQVLRIVQEMLGHTNPQTTETYLRSGTAERQSAMDW
jgi:integrase/recombinase XerD